MESENTLFQSVRERRGERARERERENTHNREIAQKITMVFCGILAKN